MRHQGPDDACILIRQSYTSPVEATPFFYAACPSSQCIIASITPANDRARPMNQQGAQIGIAAFTDTEQSRAIATGVLPGHQAEPSRQMPTIFKIADIANRCDECRSDNGAHAGDGCQTLTNIALAKALVNAAIIHGYPLIEFTQTLRLVGHHLAGQWRQLIFSILKHLRQLFTKRVDSNGKKDPVFSQKPPSLVDQGCTVPNKAHANAVQGLKVLLLNRLRRYEAHIGSSNRFADGLSVVIVVFVGLHVRFHKLWADLAYFVTQLLQPASPVVCRATDFHADQTRRKVSKEGHKVLSRKPLCKNGLTASISGMNLKDILCQIDTNCCSVHIGPFFFVDGFLHTHRGPLRGRFEEGRVHSIC